MLASIIPTERFLAIPERSALMIEARSNVGPILFGAGGLEGVIEATVTASGIDMDHASARLRLRVEELQSGNPLYDAELLRRIDARRYPEAVVELRDVARNGDGGQYDVTGDITFHGTTRTLSGQVTMTLDDRRIVVAGETDLDIRDFEMSVPSMLMLKIYPDVRVRLHLEAMAY